MDKDKQGGDVFIVDNSDTDWKVRRYLHDWADLAHTIDIATGYFEIGGLLALDGQWQKVDKFRVLMGDEVSLRTRKAFTEAIKTAETTLDESIEREKETNDFLTGVPAIVDAIRSGKIECRVYTKAISQKEFPYSGGWCWVDQNVVLGQLRVALQAVFHRPHRPFAQCNPFWVDFPTALDQRVNALPRHTFGPFQHGLHVHQLGPVPVQF